MSKLTEIKLKYPSERTRALNSMLAKKNTSLEVELTELLDQLYKKHVKADVREFIEELEMAEEMKKLNQKNKDN